MTQRDLIREIEERRPRVSDRLRQLGTHRMQSLLHTAIRMGDPTQEQLRIFPVSGIAALEVFARATIAEMVDHSAIYLQRLHDGGVLKDLKLDWTLLQAVLGKRVTVGELVAHVLPFSHYGHLDRVLSPLLARSLNVALKAVNRRTALLEGETPLPPIISDLESDLRLANQCFSLRHQIAHEDFAPLDLSLVSVKEYLSALDRLTQAISELVDIELYPNAPLTQSEMTNHAREGAVLADKALVPHWEGLRKAIGRGSEDQLKVLRNSFEAYRRARKEIAGHAFDGGTMSPMIANWEYAATTREFSDAVEGLRSLYQPDSGTEPAGT